VKRLAALALLVVALGCHKPAPAPVRALGSPGGMPTAFFGSAPDGQLHVHLLEVGDGFSALILSPTGGSVLVDGGPQSSAGHVVNRLPELLHATPDWTFLTTPRPEHLGGLNYAIRAVGTRRFLDPDIPSEQGDLAGLKQLLDERHIERVLPHPDPKDPGAPLVIDLGGGAKVQIFWPRIPIEALLSAARQTPELNSLVFRVSYGDTSVLFMGDALADTERYLLEKRFPFRSTVLVVGNHGSERATSPELLGAVQPRAAMISAGPTRGEMLPSPAVISRLEEAGVKVFRTDLDGELHLTSDGQKVAILTEHAAAGEIAGTPHVFEPRAAPSALAAPVAHGDSTEPADESHPAVRSALGHLDPSVRYVASKNSNLFHLPGCRNAQHIRPDNLITFKSRTEAMRNRRPANDCHP
jgi:competence protein ComEC